MPQSRSIRHVDRILEKFEKHNIRDSSLENESRDSRLSTASKKLKLIFFFLIFVEGKVLLGLFILTIFFSSLNIYNVPFDFSLIITLILIWFCLATILKLRELKILMKKFTAEHYNIMRVLIKYLKISLYVSTIPLGLLTAIFQISGANIAIFYIYLFSLVVLTQALIWYLMLNRIVSIGSFLFLFWFLLLVFFPITFVITEIISQFPLLTGTSQLLNFAIVMGGSGLSLLLFYNFIGHLSLMTPQEIKSTQELKIKFSKLGEIRGECFHLLPEMYARKMIPVDAEVTPLMTLSGRHSNCYISVKKNKEIKFFDVEEKIEVIDRFLTQRFKLTLSLKDAAKAIIPSGIKNRWFSFKKFLIYSRAASRLERGEEVAPQISQLPISPRLMELEKEMHHSDFVVKFKLKNDYSPRIKRVMAMLSILNKIASVDIATEICKEVKYLQTSLEEVRVILEKRWKIWKEYKEEVVKEMPIALLMPDPPKIDYFEKNFEKLSPILKACKQVD